MSRHGAGATDNEGVLQMSAFLKKGTLAIAVLAAAGAVWAQTSGTTQPGSASTAAGSSAPPGTAGAGSTTGSAGSAATNAATPGTAATTNRSADSVGSTGT